MDFEPIGVLTSIFKTRFGTPRQPFQVKNATAQLKIRRNLQPELSLQGLESFSHVWIIFVFHTNTNKIFRPKIHPPRLNGKTIGAFATRTPHRPNPIGLSLAKLEKIEGDTLYFSGIDLIDGTPVLDIKPYLKSVESQPEALDGWVESHPQKIFIVSFYQGFDDDIKILDSSLSESERDELRALITEVLEKDPRPQIYKESPHKAEHAIYLGDWNIFFACTDLEISVTKIELQAQSGS